MDHRWLPRLNARIGTNSGYIAAFARDGRVVHASTAGYADIESGRPMQLDTRVRIASMTKPVTGVAAMILVEEGRLRLDDPVERYGASADVLARVVEVAAGEPFHRFLESRIFTPLGMSSTGFRAHLEDSSRLATVYTKRDGEGLVPVQPPGEAVDWTPGGSGLISTAGDYMRFALMLANSGSYDGVRILSAETVKRMTRAHVRNGVLADRDIEGIGWGLGLAVVTDADATPMFDRNGDFWWAGYYSTTFFVSPETGLVGLVLAQDEPGPGDHRPYAIHITSAFAFMGL